MDSVSGKALLCVVSSFGVSNLYGAKLETEALTDDASADEQGFENEQKDEQKLDAIVGKAVNYFESGQNNQMLFVFGLRKLAKKKMVYSSLIFLLYY